MKVDSSNYANMMYELLIHIEHCKAKYIDQNFKVNAMSKQELSERQYQILFAMHTLKRNTVSEIAKTFNQSTATVSIIMSKLSDAGYLQRGYPEKNADKRKILFTITEKGNRTLRVLSEKLIYGLEFFYQNLTEQQRLQFDSGLTDLEKVFHLEKDSHIYLDTLLESATMPITERIAKIVMRVTGPNELNLAKACTTNTDTLLTLRQFHVLRTIIVCNINTISRMESMLPIKESTLSTILSKMADNGFVEKQYNLDTDGRKIFFHVTETGKKEYERILQEIISMIEQYFRERSETEQELLYRCFSKMNAVFQAERQKATLLK